MDGKTNYPTRHRSITPTIHHSINPAIHQGSTLNHITMGKIQSLDPATGQVWQEYDSATPQQVQAAVAKARDAQKKWGALSIKQRVAYLQKFYGLLFARRLQVAALITRENGKPTAEAFVAEVIVGLDLVKYYLRYGPLWLMPKPLPHENLALKLRRAYVYHAPFGVI